MNNDDKKNVKFEFFPNKKNVKGINKVFINKEIVFNAPEVFLYFNTKMPGKKFQK